MASSRYSARRWASRSTENGGADACPATQEAVVTNKIRLANFAGLSNVALGGGKSPHLQSKTVQTRKPKRLN